MIKIRYKLYKEVNPHLSAKQQVLYNRGIPVETQEHWLNADWGDINDWRLLGEKKMRRAAQLIYEACTIYRSPIGILVDEDPDGANSAVLAANFLHRAFGYDNVKLIFHNKKVHGLSDVNLNEIAERYPVLWIPDAASNDYEELAYLHARGVDCILTDHHLAPYESEDAIVINNQLCDYPNKDFCGAGITWQLCRCIEEIYLSDDLKTPIANSLIDLCACGNISDMMDSRSLETKAVSRLGIEHLDNKMLKNMASAHEYSINKMNGLNYLSWAFYITPFLNCCFRSGTQEEKEFVIKSLLDTCATTKVMSSKRGHTGEEVYMWEEAITIAERVKRRQTKAQDEAMAMLEGQIKDNHLTDNAIILCKCKDGEIEPSILGLAANKIQAKYQHPTLVLREVEEDGIKYLKGSGRNYSNCEIEDMRSICEETGLVEYAQGHAGAFGCCLKTENEQAFIKATNKAYEGVEFVPTYWVDYIWNVQDHFYDQAFALGGLDIYGQNVQESLVCLEKIPLSASNVTLMGLAKGHPTLKIKVNGVDVIKFHSSQEEYEEFISPGTTITLVAKPALNEWNGNISPQLLVEDFELSEKIIDDNDDDFEEWVF